MNVADLVVALVLFAVATAAALSLPRWRTSLGPVLETVVLVLVLTARGERWLPAHWAASLGVPALVMGYVLLRVQRFAAQGLQKEPPAERSRRLLFDPVAVERSLHLVPLAAYVLWEFVFAPERSMFQLRSLPTPLFAPLVALFSSRRAAVPMVVILSAGGVAAACWPR